MLRILLWSLLLSRSYASSFEMLYLEKRLLEMAMRSLRLKSSFLRFVTRVTSWGFISSSSRGSLRSNVTDFAICAVACSGLRNGGSTIWGAASSSAKWTNVGSYYRILERNRDALWLQKPLKPKFSGAPASRRYLERYHLDLH